MEGTDDFDYSIMIVDDDKDILELLERTLSSDDRADYEIVTSGDAPSALDIIDEREFDMLISDHKMAGMTGVELLSKIRNEHPNIIRVLITGYSELDLAKDAINKAKVHHYIEKPWNNKDIRNTIFQALESKEEGEGIPPSLEELDLEKGESYLLKEKDSDRSIDFSLKTISEEGKGLIITRINPENLKERYDLEDEDIEVYWLTRVSGKGNLNPVNLELIADRIIRFYEKTGGIILLEGIEALLRDNSFKRFIGFIDNIVDVADMEDGIFMVTLDPDTISEKELAHLERKMTQIEVED